MSDNILPNEVEEDAEVFQPSDDEASGLVTSHQASAERHHPDPVQAAAPVCSNSAPNIVPNPTSFAATNVLTNNSSRTVAPCLVMKPDNMKSPKGSDDDERLDDIIKRFSNYLPADLKQPYMDALIIHSDNEDDIRRAEELKTTINGFVYDVEGLGEVSASAALIDEVVLYVTSKVDKLEHALALHTYIFVLYTSDLVNDAELKTMSNASFWEAVCNPDRLYCFVPVFAKSSPEELKLSPYINERKGLYMCRDGWKASLRRFIELRVSEKLQHYKTQRQRKVEYLYEKFPDNSDISAARAILLGLQCGSADSLCASQSDLGHIPVSLDRTTSNNDIHAHEPLKSSMAADSSHHREKNCSCEYGFWFLLCGATVSVVLAAVFIAHK